MQNTPIYTISTKIIDLVAQIAERVGEIKITAKPDLNLRKINRLRSIQSSIAIENNTLSLQQVTDIINGKRVLGTLTEIAEAKNAFEAYEHLTEYEPYKTADFLRAHKLMSNGLIKEVGKFRSCAVGVFNSDKKLIHAGADYRFVPQLIDDLFKWAKNSDLHALIKSCIVHFEIELIHPFADGNGRMGRLWQNLILSRWNVLFAWLPVETIVYENQKEYYNALQTTATTTDSQYFIEFMLKAILQALDELQNSNITDIIPEINTDIFTKNEMEFINKIAAYILKNGEITNRRAQILTGKSAESVKKHFAKFVAEGVLEAHGENKGRIYKIKCTQNNRINCKL